MADYESIYTGPEIDRRLTDVDGIGELRSDLERSDDTTLDGYNERAAVFDDITSAATKTTGQFVQSNGSVGSSALWNYYSIPVSAWEIYKVSAYQSDVIKSCLFVDQSNNVLAFYPTERDTDLKRYTFDVTAPADAAYLIVNERTGTERAPSVIEKLNHYNYSHTAEYDIWKADHDAILSTETSVDIPASEITEKTGYYIASDGTEQQSNLWRIMTISVTGGEKYQVSARFYSSIKGVFFYDANDSFIPPFYGNESDDTLHTLNVIVPSNATTMRVNDKKSSGFGVQNISNRSTMITLLSTGKQ